MTLRGHRFPYIENDAALKNASLLPYVPLNLSRGQIVRRVSGLIDSGAALNVLPLEVGLQLGAVWEEQAMSVRLTGNLGNLEARAIVVDAQLASFAPVRLAFAWTQSNEVPVILGQVNFFMEFDVCFFRSQGAFEIKPKGLGSQ